MELYVLDDSFRRIRIIDKFESLIWTERHAAFGDFELLIAYNQDTRNILSNGTCLGINTSLSVMIIETTEDKKDSDGRRLLNIKGRSIESILLNRIAKKYLQATADISRGTVTVTIASPAIATFTAHGFATGEGLYFTTTGALPTGIEANSLLYAIVIDANTFYLATSYEEAIDGLAIVTTGSQSGVHTLIEYGNEKWIINDTPGEVARRVFYDICVNNLGVPSDNIPFINYPASLFPVDTIIESSAIISVEITPDFVYNVIKTVIDTYDMGFRLYRGLDDESLYFNVYIGSDRTTTQTELPAVIFSPDLDNLTDTAELSSIAVYKNVAYVVAPNGFQIVYGIGADETTIGFDRYVLYVDANDITELPGVILDDKLLKRGQEALSENRALTAFDGQVPHVSKYRYMRDYFLGDLVEKRNDDVLVNIMHVNEHITAQDSNGERHFPTLVSNDIITPGTWIASIPSQVWDDVPDGEVWDNQ